MPNLSALKKGTRIVCIVDEGTENEIPIPCQVLDPAEGSVVAVNTGHPYFFPRDMDVVVV